jgi:hypothetical protein
MPDKEAKGTLRRWWEWISHFSVVSWIWNLLVSTGECDNAISIPMQDRCAQPKAYCRWMIAQAIRSPEFPDGWLM